MKQRLAEIVQRAQQLYDDLSLDTVRAWKQATGGPPRRAVGHKPH